MKELLRQQIGDALQACFDNNILHSGVAPEVQIEVPVALVALIVALPGRVPQTGGGLGTSQ